MKIKKEVIYFLLLLVIILPLIFGISFKIKPTEPVINFFQEINSLKKGSFIVVTISFDPSTKAELLPMLDALTYHLFKNDIIPVYMNPLNANVTNLGYLSIKKIARKMKKKENSDYYYLGFVPGDKSALQDMGEDFYSVYKKTFDGKDLENFNIFKNIQKISDFSLLIDLADGNSTLDLLTYINTKYGVPMASGVTAVMASEYYPYLNSGQLLGLLGGLRGAAEYETLLDMSAKARRGMSAQTFAHILIFILIIIGNYEYFKGKRHGNN
jgi:ribosomal protein S6